MWYLYGFIFFGTAYSVWALARWRRKVISAKESHPKSTTYCVTVVPEGEDPFGMNVMRFQYRNPPRDKDGKLIPPLIFKGGDADEERCVRERTEQRKLDEERVTESRGDKRAPTPFERMTGQR